MSNKNKLFRFAEVQRMPHVLEAVAIEEGSTPNPKGEWRSQIFKGRSGKIQLELACGKGEYSLFFAKHEPEGNYIGVDIKGARIYVGAKQVEDESLPNVAFLRTYIEHLDQYFEENEVDDIWIVFADPFLGPARSKKRLTSPRFLQLYQKILKNGGKIHLKTDSETLWFYSLAVINELGLKIFQQVDNVYEEATDNPILTNKTFYELSHLQKGRIIRYVQFGLTAATSIDPKQKIVLDESGFKN